MNKKTQWIIKKGWPEPLGVSRDRQGVNFAVEVKKGVVCELILYRKGSKNPAGIIPFSEDSRIGNVLSVFLEDFLYEKYEYRYRMNGKEVLDPYSLSLEGRRSFGRWEQWSSGFFAEEFDWQEDVRLGIPMNEVILYCMHLRGFTRQNFSGVEHKGTFLGLIEKIPYLKALGVNQVELMPVYEFAEVIREEEMGHTEYRETEGTCINYWGYSSENYYYAVKKTYAAGKDERAEFKRLVRELHKNGIELVLEFYFQENVSIGFVANCLKYWLLEYHVDGFHLTGSRLIAEELFKEPLLTDTKIYVPALEIDRLPKQDSLADSRQAAVYSIDYLMHMRSFLKGDSGKSRDAAYYMRRNGDKAGFVNYFTCHDGFTMLDLVSFDQKHNETNAEGGMDGWNYNISWNCGIEGKTRKTRILGLRKRQMKNAWVMLLLSQGIPAILAGDELCNTQDGNNNVYCQDNTQGWVNWKCPKYYEGMQAFVRQLIQLRKEHPIFHLPRGVKMTDERGIGYPDLSYHSEKAWYIDYQSANHYLGVLYCGEGAENGAGTDDYFYIAYNMNWMKQSFALPDLPKGRQWSRLIDTGSDVAAQSDVVGRVLEVLPRSIVVLIGKKVQEKQKNEKNAKRG